MTEEKLLSLLALQSIPLIGDVIAKKLITHCGSPEAVFKETKTALLKIEGIGTATIRHLDSAHHFKLAENELNYIKKHKIDFWYYEDNIYPEKLKHCIDGPILLFKKGAIDLTNKRIISIVGTREMTSYGASFCEKLIHDIAPLNPIIVSGFAYGIDITAQKAALNNGLQTIGCLAHGLNQIYPKQHNSYKTAVEENGGFITDFWSNSMPERQNFLKRNRIIAGLSEATIVIESAEKGGSLVTADIASSYHREVFAVPGRTNDAYSLGCNNLIKTQKAHMLTSVADLIYILDWDITSKPEKKDIQEELFVTLNETEEKIFNFLKTKDKALLDAIALACNIPVYKTASALLQMELKGVIKPLQGKLFEII